MRCEITISRFREFATLYLRIALATSFLTSVIDRFGRWGPFGAANIAWGDMAHFIPYAAKLNPWFPVAVIPSVAGLVTDLEILLAAALLLGFHTRRAAHLSVWLLLAFAIGMTVGTGVKSATKRVCVLSGFRRIPLAASTGFR